jgi:hypothetical protein
VPDTSFVLYSKIQFCDLKYRFFKRTLCKVFSNKHIPVFCFHCPVYLNVSKSVRVPFLVCLTHGVHLLLIFYIFLRISVFHIDLFFFIPKIKLKTINKTHLASSLVALKSLLSPDLSFGIDLIVFSRFLLIWTNIDLYS